MKAIKSIKTQHTEIDGSNYTAEYSEYDKAGHLILNIKYDPDGSIIEKNEYAFDENGRKQMEKNYLTEDELAEDHRYVYDDEGKLKEEHITYAEGYEAIRRIVRDKDKNLLLIEELDEDGEVEEYTEQEYNKEGKIVRESEFDDRGKLKTAKINTFNDKGQLVRQEEYEKKMKKPISIKEFSHTDGGEIASVTMKNRKGKITDQFVLEYDDEQRVTSQKSPLSGNILIEYDDNYRKEIITDTAGNVQNETEFYYDDSGNLIREKNQMLQKDYSIAFFEPED